MEAPHCDGLDAALLLTSRTAFHASRVDRLRATIGAVRGELAAGGPLLYRTSRLRGEEGSFVACAFWLAEALARVGRLDDAREVMDDLVGYASDVGLFSEEIDPATGAFLGNMPQALSHIALINAALELQSAADHPRHGPRVRPATPGTAMA